MHYFGMAAVSLHGTMRYPAEITQPDVFAQADVFAQPDILGQPEHPAT